MEHLISNTDLQELCRPLSSHIDSTRIDICVDEAERLDVIPTLSDTFFLTVLDNKDQESGYYQLLINGGEWTDSDDNQHILKGLKAVVAYYTYARLIRLSDSEVTRYGFVSKQDEYSSKNNEAERLRAYTDARLVADGYLRECVSFLKTFPDEFPLFKGNKIRKYGRVKFDIIGE